MQSNTKGLQKKLKHFNYRSDLQNLCVAECCFQCKCKVSNIVFIFSVNINNPNKDANFGLFD